MCVCVCECVCVCVCECALGFLCTFRAVDSVAERLLQWLPYLLEHLDAFINRFHTQTVSLGKTTVLLELYRIQ